MYIGGGRKWHIKKRKLRCICLNLVAFLVLIIHGYLLGQVDFALVKTLTFFYFLGMVGGIYSNQQSRRKYNWYWKGKLIEFKIS